ncbi:MAG TPA: caspase family protein [Methylomirabilota bacterium]|nr:caspase family protein [Methylomirabilota bacterium]
MRKLLAVAGILAAALCPATVHAQKPRAELPTYELGDQWFRSDGVFELTRIEEDRYVFTSSNNREVHLAKDLAPLKTYTSGYWVELDPPFRLKWPLEVGKWGSSTTKWKWHGYPAGGEARLQWEVKAYEDVSVGGKTYKAFRVEWEVRHKHGPYSTVAKSQTLWYAPEARQWVKADGDRQGMMPLIAWNVFDVPALAAAPILVRMDQPGKEERIADGSTRVSARIRTRAPIAHVSLTVNGAEVYEQRTPEVRDFSVYEPVALKEGKNVILLTVTDKGGVKQQEARVVYGEKPAAPPAVATPAAPEPKPTPPPAVAAPAPRSAPPAPTPVIAAPEPKAMPPPAIAAPGPKPTPPPAIATPEPKPAPPPRIAALPPVTTPAPPSLAVRLASPADKAKSDHDTIALAGLATGGRGISRVVVTLNGVELMKQDEKASPRAVSLNLPLKLREGANTLVVSVVDADGAIEQEIRTVAYEKPIPFAISFRYPEDRAKVSDAASLVAAVVESSGGISQARIAVNGQEIHQQTERTPQRSMLVTAPVTLRQGANAIVVSATQTDGTVRQEIRTVVYEAPKVVALPPPPAPKSVGSDRWAVVIGVGAYESKAIPRLRFTVADAEAVYQTLIGPAGFKKDNVLLLTDKAERKPTLRNIKWALGTFLGRSAKKDDTVLIFFAGHGAPEVDTRGIERDGLAKYLIPADADPDDLYSTALPMDELQTIFARIEADRVVAFLDACYSGAAGGRSFSATRTRAGAVDDLFLERLTRSKGRAIVTASRPAEVSIELPELGHGIFTYYLVNGLKGAADLNRDGIVTLQELYEYVEQQVSVKSRASGGNQHPVMKGEMEGVLPLTKVAR